MPPASLPCLPPLAAGILTGDAGRTEEVKIECWYGKFEQGTYRGLYLSSYDVGRIKVRGQGRIMVRARAGSW